MGSSARPERGSPGAGRGALVTGASRGIGAAISRALARYGFSTLLVGRDSARLSAVVTEIRTTGGTADMFVQDLTAPDAAERVVEAAKRMLPEPYLLVNNAGVATAQRFERRPREEWEREIVTDLVAPLRLTHAFLPLLLRSGRGQLIFIGSASADRPLPRLAVYSAAKAALRGFARALDLEVARRGVRVSVVEPVYVRTELGRRPSDVEAPLERRAREHPHSTLAPDAVARAVVRLLDHPRPVVRVPWGWAASRFVLGAFDPFLGPRRRLPPPGGGEVR